MPPESSAMEPLPYFPNLRRALASHGAALLLIYFEVHFAPPQDSPDAPVLVSQRRVLVDLQLGEWVFRRYAAFIGTRFPSNAQRIVAARAGREFYRADKRVCGTLKPYSLTAAGPGMFSLRRNHPRLCSLLDAAGISAAQLGAFSAAATRSQGERETSTRHDGAQRVHVFGAQFSSVADFAERSPEVAAAEVARSLSRISGLGDGRRSDGLKRAPHKRAAWTPERRAKWERTIAAKKAARSGASDVCSESAQNKQLGGTKTAETPPNTPRSDVELTEW